MASTVESAVEIRPFTVEISEAENTLAISDRKGTTVSAGVSVFPREPEIFTNELRAAFRTLRGRRPP